METLPAQSLQLPVMAIRPAMPAAIAVNVNIAAMAAPVANAKRRNRLIKVKHPHP